MFFHELIDIESYSWKLDELQDLFSNEDVGLICTMPIVFTYR